MSVVLPNGSYSFTKIDRLYDYILSIGMYPYVELSFMPELLASGTATWLHYKGNVTPPRSYEKWAKVSCHISLARRPSPPRYAAARRESEHARLLSHILP